MKKAAPRHRAVEAADKVCVAVRVRPFLKSDAPGTSKLRLDAASRFVEGMRFDHVFDETTSQTTLFKKSVEPLLDSWLEGYNCCIFAYGQTGSGKTFTMLGNDGGKKRLDGVIPQVAGDAFRRVAEEQRLLSKFGANNSQFQIRASYLEVYNEEVRDLLRSEKTKERLSVREDGAGNVYVEGRTETRVTSTEEVLQVIELGSRCRATGRTNMNEHSSRSHAVFTLLLEHRWRDPNGPDPRVIHCKCAEFNLVDLAGSEDAKRTGNQGTQMRESIAINTSLLALGKVIAALGAGGGSRGGGGGGGHIPYRDSALTRILQSSLGGDSRTLMIACVSPAAADADETLGALRYASGARSIRNAATQHVGVAVDGAAAAAAAADVADPDGWLDRRCVWIDTAAHGPLYARCVGSPDDELILFVHGSGPTNSSTFWNGLVHELAVVGRRRFYMVAIDCPGYGRSPGDRQTVRSSPGALVGDVIRSLGKQDALCLVGSSQGACAVFNAVLEFPGLARHVVVMDPVGHDVTRYTAIQQPCLLIFDTEDDGHPVKVGRWMRDRLQRCVYHEFAGSETPYWHSDNMANEMLALMSGGASAAVQQVRSAATRLAGGLVAWAEHGGYGEPIKQVGWGLLQPPSAFLDELLGPAAAALDAGLEDLFGAPDPRRLAAAAVRPPRVWRAELCERTRRVFYVCDSSGESSWKHPPPGDTILPPAAPIPTPAGPADISQPAAAATADPAEDLFAEDSDDGPAAAVETAAAAAERLETEAAQTQCDLCGEALWRPFRAPSCRHVVCALCARRSVRHTARCPICSAPVADPRAGPDPAHQARLEALESARARAAELDAYDEAAARQCRITIEYGNTAALAGGIGDAHAVEAFVRVVRVERGPRCSRPAADPRRAVVRAEFDINPEYPKAAVKVTAAPFTLARTMASRFPCNIKLVWAETLQLPPVVIPYRVRHDPATLRHLVLVVPDPSPPAAAAAQGGVGGGGSARPGAAAPAGWARAGAGNRGNLKAVTAEPKNGVEFVLTTMSP